MVLYYQAIIASQLSSQNKHCYKHSVTESTVHAALTASVIIRACERVEYGLWKSWVCEPRSMVLMGFFNEILFKHRVRGLIIKEN